MLGHLSPTVVGQALAHGSGNANELVAEGLQCVRRRCRVGMGQLDQHHQPCGALHQGTNGAGIVGPLDEVALPVAWKLAVLNFWRAHMDAQQVLDFPTPVLALGARPALGVGHAQTGHQLLSEFAPGWA